MRHRYSILVFLVVAMIVCGEFAVSGQQILNGSFEDNILDCGTNLGNELINMYVADIFAYGGQSEIDLLSVDCGFDQATDGDYFIALYHFHFSDEFAFYLTLPLRADRVYNVRFSARIGEGIENYNTRLQLGVSKTNDTFGALVYTSQVLDSTWTEYNAQFIPDEDYTFLTVRLTSIDETWVFLDGFSMECPTINLGNDTAFCIIPEMELDAGDNFQSYLWNDLSVESHLTIDLQGTYWVEAFDGQCTIRDTIVINELPFGCNCGIFTPSAFSPNNDGVNDHFAPVSPCEFMEYNLTVYDRWGSLVFEGADPVSGWDGGRSGNPLPGGVYMYRIRYRFYYQEGSQFQAGDITLLR